MTDALYHIRIRQGQADRSFGHVVRHLAAHGFDDGVFAIATTSKQTSRTRGTVERSPSPRPATARANSGKIKA
ncbi:MAG: hypothetical protein AB8B51_01745 [Sedimentitalea sp.]